MRNSPTRLSIQALQLGFALTTALFAGSVLLAGCDEAVQSGCKVGDTMHAVGDSFPSPDGCNTCGCGADGMVTCTALGCVVTCDYEGQIHQAGESFPSSDGCNTCTCSSDGQVGCTEKGCITCTYAGSTYNPGESFPALDGCNTCTCGETGSIGCTKIGCPCDPDKEWWRKYVSEDPAQCLVIDYMCEPNTGAFSNDCGCGCQQDPSCPRSSIASRPSPAT